MLRLRILWRMIGAILVFSLPLLLVSLLLIGPFGVLIGLSLGALSILSLGFLAERIMVKLVQADSKNFKGLERSLEWVAREEGVTSPRLLVFADPSPDALALRSFGGRGIILVSQGLIGLLNEQELRALLRISTRRIWQPGAVLQSICAVLVASVMAIAPKSWSTLVFSGRSLTQVEEHALTPISGLLFLSLFPMIRYFMRTGKLPQQNAAQNADIDRQDAYLSAMQKVVQAVQVLRVGRSQRAFSLFSTRF